MENFSVQKLSRLLPLIIIWAVVVSTETQAQPGGDMSFTNNTNCEGSPCSYDGPSILINELMLSPSEFDGSMWGGSASSRRGEWIELYNPDICEAVDISCYYLGNNANDNDPYPGGYVIPPGTVVPAAGFALIRGENADPVPAHRLVENGGNVVELVVDGTGVCVGGGSRLWFPNSGGWFAFYDRDGVPQDAVSWGNESNVNEYPCTPTISGCGFSGTLSNYSEFPADRKAYILAGSAANHGGESIRRIPDGGAWSGPSSPTYARCNSSCADLDGENCNGTATVTPHGGTPPYSFLWDDPMAQTTETATLLCAGVYCVEITDFNGETTQHCVTVEDISHEIEIEASICPGESYTLPDHTVVTESGQYPVMLQTVNSCDSLITVNLTVNPAHDIELSPTICHGYSYTLPDGTEVTDAGTYSVNFQTVHGCDSIYTVHLSVDPPIEIDIEAEICRGDSHQLPDGTTVTDEGIYNVLIPGDGMVCDTTYIVELSFFPDFEIQNSITDVSCHGANDGSIVLNINGIPGDYDFLWSDGQDHGSAATNLPPGTYEVVVTNENGCEETAVFEVSEPDPVSITANADELICHGSESDLSAAASGGTGSFTYHWSHSPHPGAETTVHPDEDTAYTVFATDENGCATDTLLLAVSVINMYPDSLEVSEIEPICFGEETEISAQYTGQYPPYTYSWSHGLPDGPGPHILTPDVTTIYTVTVSDDCGNEVTKNIEVEVLPLPVVQIAQIEDVSCNGAEDGRAFIDVGNGTAPYNFVWSDGQDHGDEGQNLDAGSYHVEVIDLHGCAAEVSFDIAEPTLLEISLDADTLICLGAGSELSAQANGGTGAATFHWSHAPYTGGQVTVNPASETSYSVFATDENGCVSETLEVAVSVIAMYPGLLTAVNDTAVCPGEEVSLFASYSGLYPPYDFDWSEGLFEGPGPHVVAPQLDTTYTLTVRDGCDNVLTTQVEVGIFDLPTVQISDDLIAGCSPLEIALYDSINHTTGFVHEWMINPGQSYFGNPLDLTLEEPGLYEVSLLVTSPEGCSAMSDNTLPIEVYELPFADFTASKWSTGIDEPEVIFNDAGAGFIFSEWRLLDLIIENEPQVTHIFADTGLYAVEYYVENEFGCRDSITKWVTINITHDVDIPNAFTPGQGGNPYYDPQSTSNTIFYPFAEYVSEYQMSIFNRWGELIFMSDELAKGWNGTYRDKPVPMDVYIYKIELVYTDGKRNTLVGDLTLFR